MVGFIIEHLAIISLGICIYATIHICWDVVKVVRWITKSWRE